MSLLQQIRNEAHARGEQITANRADWPCRKGCDDCCRHLASAPRVSEPEWREMEAAIHSLPVETARAAWKRIRASAGAQRPVLCPLLDEQCGACLIYEARPVACRAYGFYAERSQVLGCARIEAYGERDPSIIWGNHTALEDKLGALGSAVELAAWAGAAEMRVP